MGNFRMRQICFQIGKDWGDLPKMQALFAASVA
jgi:hypothetical protein